MAAMHTALQAVVKYFNASKASPCVNDVILSRIQHKFVSGALVACAILSGLSSWYSSIDCATSDSTMVEKSKYVEDWCYANSTFVVKDSQNGFVVGNQYSSTAERIFHVGYYQWVTLALLLQAASFQIPRLLWKSFEGGTVGKVISGLAFPPMEKNPGAIHKAAIYYLDKNRREFDRHYFDRFAVCQFLYFINALLQIIFTQAFLSYEFLNLLPSFVQGSPNWNQIFPKLVKCTFLLIGPTGSPQTLDVLCVLAMNVLFEKLYLIVWIVLAIALCGAIAQNILVFKYIMDLNSIEAVDRRGRGGASDRLILKFAKLSLDRVIYTDFADEINRLQNQGV